jgi:molecular chaperone GrpE
MSSQNKAGDTMATTLVVREVLELLDNFDRAFGAIEAENDAEAAIEADYKALYDSILGTFEQLGVERVATVGTEFDYEVHQAIMQRPSESYEEGIVCEEFQKGFKIGDTLIRAAMVAVAA